MDEIKFVGWPKIPRLFREVTITEKIDGTNGAIGITEDGQVWAQSRKQIIPTGPKGPHDDTWRKRDNHGFGEWVGQYQEVLKEILGPGVHHGEWWGHKIQRGYGLEKGDRRFSLFNVKRYEDVLFCGVPGLGFVPVIDSGKTFNCSYILDVVDMLKEHGSYASPGYMNPEGIVVTHSGGALFKVTFDDNHKEAA